MSTTLWLTDRAAADIHKHADTKVPFETGGVLVGWHLGGPAEIVVARAIGPGPNAVHERTRFIPDGAWTDEQVGRVYEASGRLVTYVGDWHSHPGGSPSLSGTDVETLRRISRLPEARCPHPVMVVVAGRAGEWTTKAHVLRPTRRILRWVSTVELEPRHFAPDWSSLPPMDV